MTRISTARADVAIRPYRATDRPVVRDIACRTAFRNAGSDAVFEDRELFADYWTRYYTDVEPGAIWIADREGQVVGYLCGCTNSRRFVRQMAGQIVPRVLAGAGWRLATGRYRRSSSRRFLRWVMWRAWRETPPVPLDVYPAHLHVNLIRGGYGEGLFSRLIMVFLDSLAAQGVERLHVQMCEAGAHAAPRRLLARYEVSHGPAAEFESTRPSSFARVVLADSKPWVNRAYGFRVDAFRAFLAWANQVRGF
jgi:hypothetical protein